MMEFKQVKVEELTPADHMWLMLGCKGAFDGATSNDQINAALRGDAFIFRVSGDMTGIFVLAVHSRENQELCMTALAGRGMIRHFPEFYEKVKMTCLAAQTRRLVGFVSRPGLKRVYDRKTSAVPVATFYKDELQ